MMPFRLGMRLKMSAHAPQVRTGAHSMQARQRASAIVRTGAVARKKQQGVAALQRAKQAKDVLMLLYMQQRSRSHSAAQCTCVAGHQVLRVHQAQQWGAQAALWLAACALH